MITVAFCYVSPSDLVSLTFLCSLGYSKNNYFYVENTMARQKKMTHEIKVIIIMTLDINEKKEQAVFLIQ